MSQIYLVQIVSLQLETVFFKLKKQLIED